jgi:hypothetical protein
MFSLNIINQIMNLIHEHRDDFLLENTAALQARREQLQNALDIGHQENLDNPHADYFQAIETHNNPEVVEGVLDPFHNMEMRENMKYSLRNLLNDIFDPKKIDGAFEDISDAIYQYYLEDPRVGCRAWQVFEIDNQIDGSFLSIIKDRNDIFPLNDKKSIPLGEIVARLWKRIQEHPEYETMTKEFVLALSDGIEKDGHIVCNFGKLARLLQVFERYYDDIHITTRISLRDVFSYFTQKEAARIQSLPLVHSLKSLFSVLENNSFLKQRELAIIAKSLITHDPEKMDRHFDPFLLGPRESWNDDHIIENNMKEENETFLPWIYNTESRHNILYKLYGFERKTLVDYIDSFYKRFLRELATSRGGEVSEEEKKQALNESRGYINLQYF